MLVEFREDMEAKDPGTGIESVVSIRCEASIVAVRPTVFQERELE